ncbi:KEOPS complex subunit Pcc1 [Methanoculleus sp.]|uniref:KEOPS complex subunit Pcc1 n=1 Tax=Methanoculleus sp. TaxID=90427 RepID=UPI0025E9593A|nr:KEOPS complex subunit Pcc1 [Methanoculleus sp.]
MIRIEGTIETPHNHPGCVAAALEPDNLTLIRTNPIEGGVRAEIDGTRLRSIIASVDDYLMNLAIAEEVCTCASKQRQIRSDVASSGLKKR